ncbi:hypothetical protein C4564_06340 [Candidatus Microgenomates bacterium]|nr:MAG: hypothetical protein C4564_06340 [Candidatus Microgenomates bacterium]
MSRLAQIKDLPTLGPDPTSPSNTEVLISRMSTFMHHRQELLVLVPALIVLIIIYAMIKRKGKKRLEWRQDPKTIIVLFVLVTVLVLGWWYVHTTYKVEVDCFPKVGNYENYRQTGFGERFFRLDTECGSY